MRAFAEQPDGKIIVGGSFTTLGGQPRRGIGRLQGEAPGITTQPASIAVSSGEEATFTVEVTGTGPFTYQWRRNGVNIPGANGPTLHFDSVEAEDSGTYTVAIQNAYGLVSSVDVNLDVFLSSVDMRNNFADRQLLIEDNGKGFVHSTTATLEPGEPVHAGLTNNASMWITWQPLDSGIARVWTRGSDFDTVQAVYTGTTLNDLIEVAADDDSGGFLTSSNRFNVVAGTDYHIAVAGFAGASGRIVMNWDLEVTTDQVPVITAHPQSRTVSAGGNVSFNVAATGTAPLTYRWFRNGAALPGATSSSLVLIDVQASTVGQYFVEIRDGNNLELNSRSAVLELGPDPDVRTEDKLANLTYAGSGGPVLSGLGGRKPRPSGEITVALGLPGTQVFSTFGSTAQLGERDNARVIGGSSRWFEVVVPEPATLALDTLGSDFDTTLAVYLGTDLQTLQLIAEDDNGFGDGLRSRTVLPVATGKYVVKVDGRDGQQGTAQLNWVLGNPPTLSLQPSASVVLVPEGTEFHLAAATGGLPAPLIEWYLNDTVQPQWSGPDLTLENVSAAVAGLYRARAYNALGEAVSPDVRLIVDDGTVMRFAPEAVLANDSFQLQFSGSPEIEVIIYSSTDLRVWTPVHTNSGSFPFTIGVSPEQPLNFFKATAR